MGRRITVFKVIRRNQLIAIMDMFSQREMPLETREAILMKYDCGYNNSQCAVLCDRSKSSINNAVNKIEKAYNLIQANFVDI
ncbi:hypothetical protein [Photobacterium leiognathi]|uniref:hypothetical protein n=1 Tax=Photobacterium leiognathi TaxID=553611 RepID=UPI002982A0B6|nr:hypothetical protein [Photobacterium leiognathi]